MCICNSLCCSCNPIVFLTNHVLAADHCPTCSCLDVSSTAKAKTQVVLTGAVPGSPPRPARQIVVWNAASIYTFTYMYYVFIHIAVSEDSESEHVHLGYSRGWPRRRIPPWKLVGGTQRFYDLQELFPALKMFDQMEDLAVPDFKLRSGKTRPVFVFGFRFTTNTRLKSYSVLIKTCLLYTSDAADE